MKRDAKLLGLSVAIGLALNVVGAIAMAQQAADGKRSVWSGVYSKDQAERGEKAYRASCAWCHGARLNGSGEPGMPPSPAIARESFLRKWSGRSVAELVEYVQKTMPVDTPDRLSAQESADMIAYMFAVSNIPAGDKELPSDAKALAGVVIEARPKK